MDGIIYGSFLIAIVIILRAKGLGSVKKLLLSMTALLVAFISLYFEGLSLVIVVVVALIYSAYLVADKVKSAKRSSGISPEDQSVSRLEPGPSSEWEQYGKRKEK